MRTAEPATPAQSATANPVDPPPPYACTCVCRVVNASNKQTRWRYGTIKKQVVECMDKYQDGLPRKSWYLSMHYQIADELQLDIVIDVPFAQESTFINAKSQKKRVRVFKFLPVLTPDGTTWR